MANSSYNNWDQIREEIILLCVQWYITDKLDYIQLKQMMQQRGFAIAPHIINHLVEQYTSLALKRRSITQQKRIKGWRIVQKTIRLKLRRKYLYRAVDAQGNTLDFLILNTRNKDKAKSFFRKTIFKNNHSSSPKIISKKSIFDLQNNYFLRALVTISAISFLGAIIFDQVMETNNTNNPNNINNQSSLAIER